MDGIDDVLEVKHTDSLLLGDNNGDYTISFAFLQTVEPEIIHEHYALNIINKGNWTIYRSPTIYRNLENTGFCPSIPYNYLTGTKQEDALCNLPPVDLNVWVHLTYLK